MMLPRQSIPIAESGGRTSEPFYRFLQDLEREVRAKGGDTAELERQIAKLREDIAEGHLSSVAVVGSGSVASIGPRSDGSYLVRLENDSDAPGAFYVYGADADGVKGWQQITDVFSLGEGLEKAIDWGGWNYLGDLASRDDLPAGAEVNDAYLVDGTLYVWDGGGWLREDVPGRLILSLSELPDTGGGTLQKLERDQYGRVAGTSEATTDDLPEGSNLYFTDERARAAVGGGGAGGILPMVNGEVPPVLMHADDGSLIYSQVA